MFGKYGLVVVGIVITVIIIIYIVFYLNLTLILTKFFFPSLFRLSCSSSADQCKSDFKIFLIFLLNVFTNIEKPRNGGDDGITERDSNK